MATTIVLIQKAIMTAQVIPRSAKRLLKVRRVQQAPTHKSRTPVMPVLVDGEATPEQRMPEVNKATGDKHISFNGMNTYGFHSRSHKSLFICTISWFTRGSTIGHAQNQT
jgi:hypothetical protein